MRFVANTTYWGKNMQQRPCPVCESCDARVIMKFTPELLAAVNPTYNLGTLKKACEGIEEFITYSKCRQCGMVYCENVWDNATLSMLYGDTIDNVQSKAKTKTFGKRMLVTRIWYNILRVLQMRRFTELEDLKVVDFGCGWGDFLDAADGYGVTVIGLDGDSKKTELAIERGHRVVSTIDQLKSDGPFDVFVMNSVLEHLLDVSEVMNLAKEVLKPRGLFVSTVMDWRRGFIQKNMKRLKNGIPATTMAFNPLEHVNLYDYKSSLSTLKKYGFQFICTGHVFTLTDMPGLRSKTAPILIANKMEYLSSKIFTSRDIGITVYAWNGK